MVNFRSERELQRALLSRAVELKLRGGPTFVRREVPVGGCIPDLILVHFKRQPKRTLWPARWSYRHTFLLWLLRRRQPQRLASLAARCFEPENRVAELVRDLERSGAVRRTTSGALRLSRAMLGVKGEVIAVEAKLSRWRESLSQAMQYRKFADRVFVAMDAARVKEHVNIDAFRRRKVGLLTFGVDEARWLSLPRATMATSSPEREYLIASAAASRQTLWSFR